MITYTASDSVNRTNVLTALGDCKTVDAVYHYTFNAFSLIKLV